MKKLLILCCVLLFIGQPVFSQKKKKKNAENEPPKKEEKKKEPTVEEKVKSSMKVDGLLTVYQDSASGSVQIFVKKDQLDKEYIYQSFSMGGPAELFLNQNMLRETWLFTIRQSHDKIEFVRLNSNYYYDPANAISKSANSDVSESVFYSVKPEAKNDDGFLLAVDDLFLSEKLDQIKPTPPSGPGASKVLNLGSLKKDKSSYIKLRSYPNNTDFVVNLAYENGSPKYTGGEDITDARNINVKFQHSILEVPKNDYKPRYDDPRVGYFLEEVKDMTTYSVTPYKDLIHRWNLVKKDPSAALSEPVEPITWWVENTTPVEWRQTILDAGNKWNIAFEAAGFKNAVVMKMMPDDADWDPADIRYNVIRWVSSDLGYAIGPSFVNPRTGQILGADITMDFRIMTGAINTTSIYESFINPSNTNKHTRCSIGEGLKQAYGYSKTIVSSNLDADDLDKLNHQFLTELVLHEMGHTFGLNHNMKSSYMLSPAELGDQKVTREKGVTGSVMDYASPNIILNGKPIDYFTTTVGPYDKWAIEFGYRQFESNESEGIKKILSRSNEPDLIFGNDADIISPYGGVDPRVRVWDMSNDMVTYTQMQFDIVNVTLGKMKDKFIKEGQSYHELRSRYGSLRGQRIGMIASLSGYVGGIYVDRSFPEQNSENNPLTPVPEAYQKKAMNTLIANVLSPNAFDKDAELFPFLQLQRRGFGFGGSTEDPNLQAYAAQMHGIVFTSILSSNNLTRVNNTSLYGNTYSVDEIIADLVDGTFKADLTKDVNLYRRNAQTDLVKKLISVVEGKGYDYTSSAVAMASLNDLKYKLSRATAGNKITKAHRKYLVYLIEQAMDED